MDTCENCGNQFIPGQSSDMTSGACLNCGHPMRSQPNGVADDMRLRNMPDHSQDMGGNPLKEGILGDWKNRAVRDESFGSISSDMSRSLDQSIRLPWQYEAAEVEIPAEIEKVAPPGIKNEKAEEIMEEDEKKKQANIFGDAFNAVKGFGNYAVKHPWQTGLLAGGALLTGGAALPEEAAGVAAAGGAGAAAEAAGGAGADMAAQAATKAAPSLMGRAMGTLKGGLKQGVPVGVGQDVGREVGQDLGIGGGGAGGPAQPSMNMPVRGIQQLGAAGDDKETPTSHGEIPSDDTSDPEKVDPHEKNDDSGEGYFGENDVNDIGGTTSIHPDSSGGKAFLSLLPLVLHHAENGTGGQDPIMHALHEMLEGEHPGYMNQPNDGHMHEFITILQGGDKNGQPHAPEGHEEKESKTANPMIPPIAGPSVEPGVGMMGQRPGTQGHCPYCGATSDPTNQTCPQCGAQLAGSPGHGTYTAAGPESFMYEGEPTIPPEMSMNEYRHTPHHISPMDVCPNCGDQVRGMNDPTQGGMAVCPHCMQSMETIPPHTAANMNPEQMIAVQQYLIQQGREHEVANVLKNPDNYRRELAEIQKQDTPPEAGFDSGPPEPAQEQAPPGQNMPVPGMSVNQQMMGALRRWGADGIAEKCPECGSHTTGLLSNDGTSRCHTCGHSFATDVIGDDGGSSHHEHTALVHQPSPHGDVTTAPAADQAAPMDQRGQQDSSLTWKTLNGQPLQQGKRYYLHTKGVQIPDVVQIEHVKPDALGLKYEGEHGMGFRSEIPRQDAQMFGYTFTEYPGSDDYQPEADPNDDNSGYEGEPEQTDASDTHQYVNSHTAAGMMRPYWKEGLGHPEVDKVLNWGDEQMAQGGDMQATHMRMEHMFPPTVDPQITHQALEDWLHYNEDQPQQGALTVPDNLMQQQPANTDYYDGRDLGSEGMSEYFASYEAPPHEDPELDWLTEGTKLAGKKFTPMEQREFIDERGVARNADKLQLQGTHYESRVELDEDDFLFL